MKTAIPIVLLLAAGPSTCPPTKTSSSEPPDPPAVSPERLEAHMDRHFEDVSAVKDALVDGDLEAAKERAAAIADDEDPALYPVSWRPHVADLVAAAEAASEATDFDAAATRAAELGAACGRCHQSVAAKPTFPEDVEPEEDLTLDAQMERHRWATDRMWEGLVGPSDWAWDRGTAILPSAPGCPLPEDPDPKTSEYTRELCERVGALGRVAAGTHGLSQRARVYGDILRTCTECHGETRVSPDSG